MQTIDQAISKRCTIHNHLPCDQIHISNQVSTHLICLSCIKKSKIKLEQVLDIRDIENANEETIFLNFPPLPDQIVQEQLNSFQEHNEQTIQDTANEIGKIFDTLELKLIEIVQESKKNILKKLNELSIFREKVFDIYNIISKKKEMQQILRESKDLERNFHELILDIFSNADENLNKIKNPLLNFQFNLSSLSPQKLHQSCEELFQVVETFLQTRFNFEIKQQIAQPSNFYNAGNEMITNIIPLATQQIISSPTSNSFLNEINFISSSYGLPILINRNQQNQLIVKGEKSDGCYHQGYSNFIIDPKQRYIFRIHLSQQSGNNYPQLGFGLCKDQKKDEFYIYQGMNYFQSDNNYGVKKVIKGEDNYQSIDVNKTFEMRIHIQEKLLRVGSYPEYDQIFEQDDKSKLNEEEKYRFFLLIAYLKDSITLVDALKVDKFDENM